MSLSMYELSWPSDYTYVNQLRSYADDAKNHANQFKYTMTCNLKKPVTSKCDATAFARRSLNLSASSRDAAKYA